MAMSLMHGPSMVVAEQTGALAAHLSPHASHAARSEHQHAADAAHGQPDSSAPHHHTSQNTAPNCPLANIAAIAALAPVCSPQRIETRFEILPQPTPVTARLAALDPPPRLTA